MARWITFQLINRFKAMKCLVLSLALFFILFMLGVMVLKHAEQSLLLKDFSEGYNQFSADLYKELLKTDKGNLLVCPLALGLLLALLTSEGAKGPTAYEISSTLHLPETSEKIRETFTAITPHLQGNDKFELSTANKVYLQDGFEISGNFEDMALDVFDVEIENVDFTDSVKAANIINKWVENRTNDKVKDLVSKDLLNQYTRVVLVNTIYFHGKWLYAFDKLATKRKPFYVNASHTVEVDMMFSYLDCDYYESEDARVIRLPYQGNEVSLHVILPKQKDGLTTLEGKLKDALAIPQYSLEKVQIGLPKFKIDSFIEFSPILEQLGIKKAFNDKDADFGGVTAEKQSLRIDKVIQKAYIEVKEEEASATAERNTIGVMPVSAPSPPVLPKEFIADHPFLFLLHLDELGISLFLGAHKTPTKVD